MVEVTKSNFEEILPKISEDIRNASFIAFDAEFTGLNLGTSDNFSLFDCIAERYKKLRARATSFTISQIGLSTFTKHAIENSYSVKTYVFFIRPYLCGSTDKRFMCQASCLDFLCRYDFDFNKFIKEGIPFINEMEEKKLCSEIEEGSIIYLYDLLKREEDMLINDQFLGLNEQSTDDVLDDEVPHSSCPHTRKKIVIPKDNLYPEYFQLNQIRNKYPSLWAFVEGENIIVEEVSAKQRRELQVTNCEEKEKVMNFFLGFTRVFRVLKEARKPIVGHNFTMDLLLCFHNFHKPLPENYETFKQELHSVFPMIYDTRHIWRHVKKFCKLKDIPKQCGLFELYEMFKRTPDSLTTLYFPGIEFSDGNRYGNEEFPHEAGYDSYITGWVFLHICHVLAMKNIKSARFIEPQTLKQHLNAVAPFVNKINQSRSRYNYINLEGNDPPPSVPEMLHVCWKSKVCLNEAELAKIFSRYGSIDIKLLGNRREAVIIVASFGSFRAILKDFKDHKHLIVSKYNVLKHSPYLNGALWLTAVGSACLVAFLVMKLITDK